MEVKEALRDARRHCRERVCNHSSQDWPRACTPSPAWPGGGGRCSPGLSLTQGGSQRPAQGQGALGQMAAQGEGAALPFGGLTATEPRQSGCPWSSRAGAAIHIHIHCGEARGTLPLPRDRGACPQGRGELRTPRPGAERRWRGARAQLHSLHQGTRCASGNGGLYIDQDLATLFWETTLKKYFCVCINIYIKRH